MKKSDFTLGINDKEEESEDKEETGEKKRRQLPGISEKAWNGINEIRKEKDITWNELIEQIYHYQDWLGHLLTLPPKPTIGDKLNAVTVTYYMPLWLKNIYLNFFMEHIKDINDIKEIFFTEKGKPAIVIGAGPSLHKYKHLELLAQSEFYKNKEGPIITTSHTVKDCLEAGVIPDYMVLLDPQLHHLYL